jgi:hypothetical protein
MNAKKNKNASVKDKSSKFYVLLRSDTQEFLVRQNETRFGYVTEWGKSPQSAQKWKNVHQARGCGMLLSGRKSIEIQVCSVVDLGAQYQVETQSTFFAPSGC